MVAQHKKKLQYHFGVWMDGVGSMLTLHKQDDKVVAQVGAKARNRTCIHNMGLYNMFTVHVT